MTETPPGLDQFRNHSSPQAATETMQNADEDDKDFINFKVKKFTSGVETNDNVATTATAVLNIVIDENKSTTVTNNNNCGINGFYYICVRACAAKLLTDTLFYPIFMNIVSLVNLLFTIILLYNIIKKVFSRMLRYQSTIIRY